MKYVQQRVLGGHFYYNEYHDRHQAEIGVVYLLQKVRDVLVGDYLLGYILGYLLIV